MVLSSQVGPESGRAASRAVLSVRWTEWQWTASGRVSGQLGLYRGRENQQRGVAGRSMAIRPEPLPPADLRCEGGRGCRRLAASPKPAEWALRQSLKQVASHGDMEHGDGVGIMPFGANAATLAGGSPAAAPGLIVQHGRRGQRGKNGSARPSGTHTQQYIKWRDGEIRANSGLHSVPIPTPV